MPALPLLLLTVDGESLAVAGSRAALRALAGRIPDARLVWAEGDPDAPILAVWWDGRARAYQRFDDLASAYGAAVDPAYRGGILEYRLVYPAEFLEPGQPAATGCTICEVRAAIGGGAGRCRACYRLALLRGVRSVA